MQRVSIMTDGVLLQSYRAETQAMENALASWQGNREARAILAEDMSLLIERACPSINPHSRKPPMDPFIHLVDPDGLSERFISLGLICDVRIRRQTEEGGEAEVEIQFVGGTKVKLVGEEAQQFHMGLTKNLRIRPA
jgi:hypothetical protein